MKIQAFQAAQALRVVTRFEFSHSVFSVHVKVIYTTDVYAYRLQIFAASETLSGSVCTCPPSEFQN